VKAQKQQEAISSAVAGIKPVAQVALGPARFCFYGENKKGKTTLGASAGLKTLVVSCEPGGLEPLRDLDGVDAYEMTRWEQVDGLFWYLHSGDHPYEVFSIDSVTMWQTLLLRYVMDNETRLDPLTPQTPHHQKVARILNNEILRWVGLPVHQVWIAQQRNITVKKEELGGDDVLQRIAPNLSPSPLSTLLGAVGTIGRIYTKEVEQEGKRKIQHRLLLAPNDTFIAGTRIRSLPKIMAEPTLAKILELRENGGEGVDDGSVLTEDILDEEYAAQESAVETETDADAIPTL
jgi:hypothetical protein